MTDEIIIVLWVGIMCGFLCTIWALDRIERVLKAM